MGYMVALVLGILLGFYAGNKVFREKVNKGLSDLATKVIKSQGSDDKKPVKKE